jgi:hypothetical protein
MKVSLKAVYQVRGDKVPGSEVWKKEHGRWVQGIELTITKVLRTCN